MTGDEVPTGACASPFALSLLCLHPWSFRGVETRHDMFPRYARLDCTIPNCTMDQNTMASALRIL